MAVPKRKENPSPKFYAGSKSKKPRKEEKPAKDSKRLQDVETATDSDPIVESDTTSHSGDDDGVSWPSDEEVEAGEDEEGVGLVKDNEDGGMEIAAAASASDSAKKVQKTAGAAQGMSELVTVGLFRLTSEQGIHLKRHTQSRRLKSKSAKLPSPMQIR